MEQTAPFPPCNSSISNAGIVTILLIGTSYLSHQVHMHTVAKCNRRGLDKSGVRHVRLISCSGEAVFNLFAYLLTSTFYVTFPCFRHTYNWKRNGSVHLKYICTYLEGNILSFLLLTFALKNARHCSLVACSTTRLYIIISNNMYILSMRKSLYVWQSSPPTLFFTAERHSAIVPGGSAHTDLTSIFPFGQLVSKVSQQLIHYCRRHVAQIDLYWRG